MSSVQVFKSFALPSYSTRQVLVRVDKIMPDDEELMTPAPKPLAYHVWFYQVSGVSDDVTTAYGENYLAPFNAVYCLLMGLVGDLTPEKVRWFNWSPGWSFDEENWKCVDDLTEFILNWDWQLGHYTGVNNCTRDVDRDFYGLTKVDRENKRK